jgi:hypothetical protein
MGHFPFPDTRKFDPDIAQRIREWAEYPLCSRCGAVMIRGMALYFCCSPFGDRIRDNLPPPMDERLLNRIIQLTESRPNFTRILNHDLQPVLQYTSTPAPHGPASNLFICGVPYALNTYCRFRTLVYAVFSRNDWGLPVPPGEIEEIITFVLSQNRTLAGYLRDHLDSLREIGIVLMNEPDEGINMAVFNAEGLLLNDHQMETLRNSY